MDYNFINDPELKSLLEDKNKEKNANLKSQNASIKSNRKKNSILKEKISENLSLKRDKKNEKFESLKLKSSKRKKQKVKKPSTKNLALATKQLSSMLRTGLPLLERL